MTHLKGKRGGGEERYSLLLALLFWCVKIVDMDSSTKNDLHRRYGNVEFHTFENGGSLQRMDRGNRKRERVTRKQCTTKNHEWQ